MKIEMKKRIEQELQNTVPQKITKLEFAGDCRAQQLEGLTDEFENLRDLTLTNVGLTTLKGFPKLNNLKRLTLQDNCLNGGLENLAQCINLTHLDLKGNKIQCIEQLEPLACLKSLRVLELENCEIAKTERYREKIFALLPSVKYIDGLDARGEEDEGEEFENEEADGDEENDGSFDGDENDDDDDDDEDDDEDGSEDDDASDDANEKSKKRSVIRSRPSDLIKLFSTLSFNLNASLMRPLNYKRHTGKLKPFEFKPFEFKPFEFKPFKLSPGIGLKQLKTAPSNLNEKRKEERKEERKNLRQKA